jgi:hypothetical protein
MSTEFWDETFEEQQSREKLDYFFGQYSAEVRKNLLAKNIKRPENIYDILYTKTREAMLAKNAVPTFNQDLDDKSTDVRNAMLSKHVENQINLDLSGDNYRQSQISKNNLLQSSLDLEKLSDSIRENLLSKNVEKQIDLDVRSQEIRGINISHNTEKNINLDQNAKDIRGNMLSKNVEDSINLDSQASFSREHMLSSNVKSEINLDNDSFQTRNMSLSKNNEKEINLDRESAHFRETQESKNTEKNINLDLSAESFRANMLSSNKDNNVSIDGIAQSARKVNESANIDNTQNIEQIADIARSSMVSGNIDSQNKIDSIAENARGQQESKNDNNTVNLDSIASNVRNNMLSSNKESDFNLDKSAESVRNNMLSFNKEELVNLDSAGSTIRDKMLSSNKESDINLDKSSESIRSGLLSSNKDATIDLDKSSQGPRGNLLAANVPSNIDLDANSVDPRNNLLASNVPLNTDLDADSVPVRNNLLASNVPTNIDLDVISAVPRATLINANVPINIDLEQDSIGPRNQLLSANVPNIIDLDQNSLITRNNLLSANVPSNINLDNKASQVRNNLLAANVKTPNQIENIAGVFRHDMLVKNNKSQGLGTTVFLGGTSTFIGVSNLEIISAPIRELMKIRDKVFNKQKNLQPIYGFALSGSGIPSAQITNAAQLYNLQKNAFMNVRYEDRNSGYNILLNHNSQGFQQLLSYSQLSSQRDIETNTTPASVIAANKGVYVGLPSSVQGTSSVTGLLKPGQDTAPLGSAASMMSNTVPGDAIAANFNKQERGVVHIINTIKKDTTIAMAKNYDVQNNASFIVGTNSDGTNKLAYSRYTVANPYQPNKDAGTLELRIKNYAIYNGNKRLVHTMSFPPYIKSFANSDSANWNKIDYLGRPEPIYTYSNSNREGSLSFYILTDFSQEVDVGVDYENKTQIVEKFSKHFTSQSDIADESSDIDVEIASKQSQLSLLSDQLATAIEYNVGDTASIQSQMDGLNEEISNLESKQIELKQGKELGPNRSYKEFDVVNGNVFKTLINNGSVTENGSLNIQTEQTKDRLGRMKKDLLFQPAFFSGDKVDFLNRMEFMAKLTRPARSSAARGFSFTFPPVCHIHLGSWFNHDVIINNVSYDYSDAPWTIDGSGGRVQPMWALVTLSFNIVGTYGANPGQDVPLSTDTGGFFQKKKKSTKTGFGE